jgi:microcystin degradation protein MlrC
MLKQTPSRQPMKDIVDIAVAAERDGKVLNASVFGGFPLADVPDVCLAPVLVADERSVTADDLLAGLSHLAWDRRKAFLFEIEPIARSIAHAKALADGPVILVDHGDNCGAGGSMDDMTVAAEIVRQGLEDAIIGPIWDPAAVRQMERSGLGSRISVAIGGKTDSPAIGLVGKPLQLSGVVRNITDGRFRIGGPMMTGAAIDLGGSALLEAGSIQVLVTKERCEPFDLGFLTHAGIDPLQKRYIMIKSRQHFRAGFEAIARHIVLVAGPGVCSSDYGQFPFKSLRRPIYPLDPETSWAGPPARPAALSQT